MLLNKFLYQRSLIKNEQLKNTFSILVPKNTLPNIFTELLDFEKKEYKDEPKKIKLDNSEELSEEESSSEESSSEESTSDEENDDEDEENEESSSEEENEEDEEDEEDEENEEGEEDEEDEEDGNVEGISGGNRVLLDNLQPIDTVNNNNNDTKNVVVSFF